MPNRILVAALASLGLLSSTFALAEVTDGSAVPVQTVLTVPAVVSNAVATPAVVEPQTPLSAPFSPSHAVVQRLPQSDDTPDTLAELVDESDNDLTLDSEERCLATAVYYEARSESLSGQLAVANVILQRARSGRFPTSLCGVVTQPGQFSFVRSGRMPSTPSNATQWRTAQAIAQIALDGSWENPVRGALFFHAARVSPSWNRERVTRIGGHVFYR